MWVHADHSWAVWPRLLADSHSHFGLEIHIACFVCKELNLSQFLVGLCWGLPRTNCQILLQNSQNLGRAQQFASLVSLDHLPLLGWKATLVGWLAGKVRLWDWSSGLSHSPSQTSYCGHLKILHLSFHIHQMGTASTFTVPRVTKDQEIAAHSSGLHISKCCYY